MVLTEEISISTIYYTTYFIYSSFPTKILS